MDYDWADRNPNMADEEWARAAFHYKVKLRRAGKTMTTYFSMGPAIKEPPELDQVLDSLASDAAGLENSPEFEAWAQEYGYDTDSRKAEKDFHAVETSSERLKAFLGEEAYKRLLFETERL